MCWRLRDNGHGVKQTRDIGGCKEYERYGLHTIPFESLPLINCQGNIHQRRLVSFDAFQVKGWRSNCRWGLDGPASFCVGPSRYFAIPIGLAIPCEKSIRDIPFEDLHEVSCLYRIHARPGVRRMY